MIDGEQAGASAASLTRETAHAILEALRAACRSGDEHDPSPGPSPVRVEPCREGMCAAWRGLRAEGRSEHEALAVLVRRAVAGARDLAERRRREAQRLREAAKIAPALDVDAVRIEAEIARVAPNVPTETTLDGFDADDPDDA